MNLSEALLSYESESEMLAKSVCNPDNMPTIEGIAKALIQAFADGWEARNLAIVQDKIDRIADMCEEYDKPPKLFKDEEDIF
jgi:hypothetical protein